MLRNFSKRERAENQFSNLGVIPIPWRLGITTDEHQEMHLRILPPDINVKILENIWNQ